jgi:DNA-binding GntR family transcriptional regulator
MPLQTVENRRLYRQIADQIAALIEKGEYGRASGCPRSATSRSSSA